MVGEKSYPEDQLDYLEMSLESGLYKPAGLKALKELNLKDIKTRIGVKEVQWMMEQWPELRATRGLKEEEQCTNKEATNWLKEHRPAISLEYTWWR